MMNRWESAARVTHLPTGLSAMCRVHRDPNRCFLAALSMLRAMLARRLEDPGWSPLEGSGPVVRTYDLAPTRASGFAGPVVRDHRGGVVLGVDARKLLDGGAELDRAMRVGRRAK